MNGFSLYQVKQLSIITSFVLDLIKLTLAFQLGFFHQKTMDFLTLGTHYKLPPAVTIEHLSATTIRLNFYPYYNRKFISDSAPFSFLIFLDNTKLPSIYCESTWPKTWKIQTNIAGKKIIESNFKIDIELTTLLTGTTTNDNITSLDKINLQLLEKKSWDPLYPMETIVWCLHNLMLPEKVVPIGVACGVLEGSVALHCIATEQKNEKTQSSVSSNFNSSCVQKLRKKRKNNAPFVSFTVIEHHEQGYRPSMEDASFHVEFNDYLLVGIADGHGGQGGKYNQAKERASRIWKHCS